MKIYLFLAFELEKFIREIEILKNEKTLLSMNLDEAKQSLTNKQNMMANEILRQKIAIEKLIDFNRQREKILQEDIVKIGKNK